MNVPKRITSPIIEIVTLLMIRQATEQYYLL